LPAVPALEALRVATQGPKRHFGFQDERHRAATRSPNQQLSGAAGVRALISVEPADYEYDVDPKSLTWLEATRERCESFAFQPIGQISAGSRAPVGGSCFLESQE